MPDWRKLVREKLAGLQLNESQRCDVTEELAGHLEDACEDRRAIGFSDPQAIDGALSEVVDWHELKTKIARAKRQEGSMSERTRCLWLPGLASFFVAMMAEVALNRGPIRHGTLFHSHLSMPQAMYLLWLLIQLFCGAIGAFLSRRAGGTRADRIGAALFTSGILLTTMVVVISICAAVRAMGLGFDGLDMSILFKPVVMVVLIPSTAMLIGALPFLQDTSNGALA